jgi:hypothetical protein
MIKLKLTRDQLEVLTNCFNPVLVENWVESSRKSFDLQQLAGDFSLLAVEPIADNPYALNVLLEVKGNLHQQLFNYQRRFYDKTQTSGAPGYNRLDQNPHYQLARPSGDGADSSKSATA